MKDDAPDSFLARWSRRKVAAREGKPVAERARASAPPAPGAAGAEARGSEERRTPAQQPPGERPAPATELPSVDSLRGLESDYRDFLRGDVDEGTRRAALKRLFADPHFNQMDGLDVYIDDYSQPDPIPAALLRKLRHVKDLFRSREDQATEDGADALPPVADASQQTLAVADAEAGPTSPASPSTEVDPNCPVRPPVSGSEAEEGGKG